MTRYEATLAEQQFLQESSDAIKLYDVIDSYLIWYKEQVKITSYTAESDNIKRYLLNYMSNIDVSSVTPSMIEKWSQTVINDGYSIERVKRMHRRLIALFDYSRNIYGVPEKNPASYVKLANAKPSSDSGNDVNFWTFDEFNRFISTFDDCDNLRLFFEVLYYTGMRLGEAKALLISDYDQQRKEIIVNKTITEKVSNRFKEEANLVTLGKYVILDTKTSSSNRRVLVPDWLHDKLVNHIMSLEASRVISCLEYVSHFLQPQ